MRLRKITKIQINAHSHAHYTEKRKKKKKASNEIWKQRHTHCRQEIEKAGKQSGNEKIRVKFMRAANDGNMRHWNQATFRIQQSNKNCMRGEKQ